MDKAEIKPGADALIKHVSNHISYGQGSARYAPATVTRVTKARVFARATYRDAAEREFRLDDLREYGEKSWRADELILDPEAIALAKAEEAAEGARKALEGRALVAMADIAKRFDRSHIHLCSAGEIELLINFRNGFCVPAAENAGPTP